MQAFPAQFSIGPVKLEPATVLAPMAGVTDTVFRRFIRNLGGCGLIMTEFTSSHGVSASLKTRKPNRTLQRYLSFDPDEHPISAQLFGAEELGGDRVLVGVEAEIALQGPIGLAGLERCADAVRAGELGHDEPAPAEIANESAEYRIGHAGHGRKHRGGREIHRSDRKLCGEGLHGSADLSLTSGRKPGAGGSDGRRATRKWRSTSKPQSEPRP